MPFDIYEWIGIGLFFWLIGSSVGLRFILPYFIRLLVGGGVCVFSFVWFIVYEALVPAQMNIRVDWMAFIFGGLVLFLSILTPSLNALFSVNKTTPRE